VTVGELGEHALLARILTRLPRPSSTVLVGPGDDAAVLAAVRNERSVVTTDAVVEGVHFSRAFSSPSDIGHKALAVNLSDLAAMGATPRWALLSLLLPGSVLVRDVEDLVDGVSVLAQQHAVSVVGGNITRTGGPMIVDVTAGGDVRPRRWLTRGGAKAGHEIWLSGSIGAAAAGLEMLDASDTRVPDAVCVRRHVRPDPRVRLGAIVARSQAASAMMDLSDGLADALRQMSAASGVGVRVDASALPIEPGARDWWASRGVDAVIAAIAGGDDYELLIAAPAKRVGAMRAVTRQVADPPLTKIGVFTKNAGELVFVRDGNDERIPEGFAHFAHR